jgi:hypothetical protein
VRSYAKLAILFTLLILFAASCTYTLEPRTEAKATETEIEKVHASEHECSLATLDGTYLFQARGVIADADGALAYAEAGTWTLDGAGNAEGVFSASLGGEVIADKEAFTATYEVVSGCVFIALAPIGDEIFSFDLFTSPAGDMFTYHAAGFSGTQWRQAEPDDGDLTQEAVENIVIGIVNAPPDANGTMAMEPTGINILLNAQGVEDEYFADPRHFGHQVPAGGRMEIELGGTFERNGVDNDNEFVPFDGNFNLIMLAGLPQVPIAAAAGDGIQHGNYTISDDGSRTITVTPNGGSGPNGIEGSRAAEIGIKTLHFLPRRGSNTGPSPFQNGAAGTEGTVAVRIYDADGLLLESGDGSIAFATSLGRQVAPINFGLGEPGNLFLPDVIHEELVAATSFQIVAPLAQLMGTARGETFADGAPYALRFILHETQEKQPDSFAPTLGIPDVGLVVDSERPWLATLMQDSNGDGVLDDSDEQVGEVVMDGPSDASRGRILQAPNWPLTMSGNGTDDPTRSELNVPVEVGVEEGIYTVTVTLDGGGQSTIYVVVEE